MPPAVIPAIVAIVGAAASAYGTYESTRHRGGAGVLGAPTGPSTADLAASGALRSDIMGAATPTWKGGLTGSNIPGVSPGTGSASIGDLGQRASNDLGQPADSFLKALGGS